MVREFVHGHVGDKLAQGDVAAVSPFIDDRPTVKPNDVRPIRLHSAVFFRNGYAIVKAGKPPRVRIHVLQNILWREVRDLDHDAFRQVGKRGGKRRHGFLCDCQKGIGIRGSLVHVPDMDSFAAL